MEKHYELDYEEYVRINGDLQNIRVRTTDAQLPILLFLHGGPGVCDRHILLKLHSALAERFIMVFWDQRASGKTYKKESAKEKLTVAQYVEDAKALAEYLLQKFNQKKLHVLGHSWGTVLGTKFAFSYPDLVASYTGMGQFAHGADNEDLSWGFCIDEAERRGDKKAVAKLAAVKPVKGIYPSPKAMILQRNYLTKYGGADYKNRGGIFSSLLKPLFQTKEYKLADKIRYIRGALLCQKMSGEVVGVEFTDTVKKLDMPVTILQGRYDFNTPSVLAKKWFDALETPAKTWIWFEESAHSPVKEEPDKWREAVSSIAKNAI